MNKEEQLYPEIREWLQIYLEEKYRGYLVETTYESSRQFLDLLLRRKNLSCKEAIGLKIKIDILGILKRKEEYKLVFVEVKDKNLNLKDLGQLWGYTQLINPEEAFLITSKEFGELSRIINVLKREDILKFGLKKNKFMHIAKWNERMKSIDYSTLIPKV